MLTPTQKQFVEKLRDADRLELQFSVITREFTGYVRVINQKHGMDGLIHWYRISALINRNILRLDGPSINESKEVVFVRNEY